MHFSTGQGQSKRDWYVDIAVQLSREESLLIEYASAYSHRGKQEVDLCKTQSLLKYIRPPSTRRPPNRPSPRPDQLHSLPTRRHHTL